MRLLTQTSGLRTEATRFFYACRQESVPRPDGKLGQKFVKMHQVIVGYKRPDHIDGNGLNNQKHNLRPATHAQNSRNKGKHKGTSKYKGVCKTPYKWRARIYVDGKSKFLGDKDLEIDAAKLYDEAAVKYFGKFARLNFPRRESQ
jgi:hypothetical protein